MSAVDQSPFAQELPVYVQLRGGRVAVIEQLLPEVPDWPLCGRFRVGHTLGVELWSAEGRFCADGRPHDLDIVAEIMPDLSTRPLAQGGAT